MTTIYNLYGGPGTGKSTSAAYIFYKMKKAGVNCELVREYVKKWAWENRIPQPSDQPYFLAKQARDENVLLGKVGRIVTDCPVLLSVHYARKYAHRTLVKGVEEMVRAHYQHAAALDHNHIHVFLRRTKAYNPAGRFQTEAEAVAMDQEILDLMYEFGVDRERFGRIVECGTDEKTLDALIGVIE